MKIAIIGAGITGSWLASQLQKQNHDVVVLDKGRGVGGRLATRRTETVQFDHGAPFFEIKDPKILHMIQEDVKAGVLVEQRPGVFVAQPQMNSWCKLLTQKVDLKLSHEVKKIIPMESGWQLEGVQKKSDEDLAFTLTGFDRVIATAPFAQTQQWMPRDLWQDFAQFSLLKMSPNFVMMLELQGGVDLAQISFDKKVISHVVNNSEKAGRISGTTMALVVYATAAWSEAHLEMNVNEVQDLLLKALSLPLSATALQVQTHRWRYAASSGQSPYLFFTSKDRSLCAAGDWLSPQGGVEGALLSAMTLLSHLSQ
ncbi:MAG: NAD(P)/FAD-dependent oxidoreductase [Bdellovibrionia bacterium]